MTRGAIFILAFIGLGCSPSNKVELPKQTFTAPGAGDILSIGNDAPAKQPTDKNGAKKN
jgi:hypothetical protein